MEENKSVVTSYRLKEDTKEKIKQQLGGLGLTQEEYFNRVVSLMELENVKKNNLFAINATEVQELTQRLYNIFINLCEQGNSFLENKNVELQELKQKYKDMLLDKEDVIHQLKEELQQVYNENNVLQNENEEHKIGLMKIKSDYEKQIDQLESSLRDKNSLVDEYKSKNDTLTGIVEEYKGFKDENKALNGLLTVEQTKNNNLNDSIKEKEHIIIKLNKDIEELKHKGKEEIKQLEERKDIERDKIILELNKAHQEEINSIRNEYAVKIDEYQNKYKILLEMIETGKNETILKEQ